MDVVVLLLAALIGIAGYPSTDGFSLFVPFVVIHFFLFCNVFRIRRKAELIWGGLFLLNCVAWLAAGRILLFPLFGTQLLPTVIIIAIELRAPCYHGIFARRINPRIEDYLAGRM